MSPRLPLVAIVAVSLFFPAKVFAGGPPWLVLPIDGVTAENSKACAELLTSKLQDKLWPDAGARERGVRIQEHGRQSYITFYMGEDVGLREIEQALEGSAFKVPRDSLRLFAHVVLEIDARKASPKELLSAIEKMDHVSVAESKNEGEHLLVTVDMPYPELTRDNRESVEWEKFQRTDLSSDQVTRSESPISARELPSYAAFREVIAKHKASLKTVRWDTDYVCRALGGVTVEKEKVAAAGK
jgi:hypothetical protein